MLQQRSSERLPSGLTPSKSCASIIEYITDFNFEKYHCGNNVCRLLESIKISPLGVDLDINSSLWSPTLIVSNVR